MKKNINIPSEIKEFLKSVSLESLKELHSSVHSEPSQNESQELNTYVNNNKKVFNEELDDEYEEPEEPEESKYYNGLSKSNEVDELDSDNEFELTLPEEENKYDVKKIFKGTPKPNKTRWDDYDEGLVGSKTSNSYNFPQYTVPYGLKTREYLDARSSNTTTVLSGLGKEYISTITSNTSTVLSTIPLNNTFFTPSKSRSQNPTMTSPPSTSSYTSTGTNSTTAGYNSSDDANQFMVISSSKSSHNTVNMIFSKKRLSTAFANQEDHNTAYELFVRFCTTQSTGYKIRHIPHVLSAAFSSIMTEHAVTEELENKLQDLQKNKDKYRYIRDKQIRYHSLQGVRAEQIGLVVAFVQGLAKSYTTQKSIVHFRTGNKGPAEGKNVAAAIASLKILDEFNDLRSKLETSDDNKILFLKECLTVNGRLVKGMQKIYNMSIAKIRKKFKLDADVREDDNGFDIQKATELFNYLNEKSGDNTLIGVLIENCFDFPKSQRQSKKGKTYQNMEVDDLLNAASVAIIMTSGAFPHVDINNSIPTFLKYVSENQGWGLADAKIDELTTLIRDNLNTWNSNKNTVLYNKGIEKTEEVNPAHICLEEGRITKKRKNLIIEECIKKTRKSSFNEILELEATNVIPDHTHNTTEESSVKKSRTKVELDVTKSVLGTHTFRCQTRRYQTRSKTLDLSHK